MREIETFVTNIQHEYAKAFRNDDRQGMLETSFDLLYAYALMGNLELADRWARESIRHADNPMQTATIHLVRVLGRIDRSLLLEFAHGK